MTLYELGNEMIDDRSVIDWTTIFKTLCHQDVVLAEYIFYSFAGHPFIYA